MCIRIVVDPATSTAVEHEVVEDLAKKVYEVDLHS